MAHSDPSFQLDPTLANDTIYVGSMGLCSLLLINDSRWPWLVLVPQRAGKEEIHDLNEAEQAELWQEVSKVSQFLKGYNQCEKINVGALGNIVRQLHVHVIARNKGDPNWPGPVWGYGEKTPYSNQRANDLIAKLQEALIV